MGKGRHARTGSEPVTAFSALRLRLVLSVIFTPLFAAAAVLFAIWAALSDPGDRPTSAELVWITVGFGLLTLIALTDLVVVARRLRRRRRERS
ncbi:DUF6343 family protein [Streptomyces hoynatensis]|uniref:Uncharacterized protein n=1 Tax=Streptomyces hoynatensis TaxID=1141874 RepID=A0A3A9YPH5_9ACTN|nr:DUF6343 family protein [Streptomyces hoynatensis]RKN37892.1 hypothetical protein D7294_26355 [Streptomyces hoynatensis]